MNSPIDAHETIRSNGSDGTENGRQTLFAELHCHSRYSHDGFNSLRDLIRECRRKNISVLAITDHDVMQVTRHDTEMLAQNGITLIPACEMETDNGIHLIGLFIERPLVGATLRETVAFVRDQGGLLCVPHPFKPETGLLAVSPLPCADTEAVLRQAVFIERFNGDYADTRHDEEIRRVAAEFGLTLVCGSDAHRIWEIGRWVNRLTLPVGRLTPDNVRRAAVELYHRGPFSLHWPEPALKSGAGTAIGAIKGVIRRIRHWPPYRAGIKLVPFALKRAVRELMHGIFYFRYKTGSKVSELVLVP